MKSTKPILYLLLCIISIFSRGNYLHAQQTVTDSALLDRISTLEQQVADEKKGESHFMVAGLTTFGFVASSANTISGGIGQKVRTNSMADADHYEFSPMLLWRHDKNVLLEFEPSFDGNSLGVNWADVSYFVTPGLIVRAGYFVLPFGTYNKRLAAGWIDKVAGDPIGVADLPPSSDFGVEVEGGLPMGNMKWSYDVALTNGMQLLPDGEIQNAGIVDNNKNKTVTARFALMPFSNSCLEVGVSGMFGKVGDAGSAYEGASTDMYAVDLNFVKNISPFLVNIKGQYNAIHINNQQYINPVDSSSFTFKNQTNSGFIQMSLRPTVGDSKFVKNLELAFRYASFKTPNESAWSQNTNSYDVGLDYWLSWRSVLKFTYNINNTGNTVPVKLGGSPSTVNTNSFYLQYSIEL